MPALFTSAPTIVQEDTGGSFQHAEDIRIDRASLAARSLDTLPATFQPPSTKLAGATSGTCAEQQWHTSTASRFLAGLCSCSSVSSSFTLHTMSFLIWSLQSSWSSTRSRFAYRCHFLNCCAKLGEHSDCWNRKIPRRRRTSCPLFRTMARFQTASWTRKNLNPFACELVFRRHLSWGSYCFSLQHVSEAMR